jgi:hypothetical protein
MINTIVVNGYKWIVDSAKKTVFVPKLKKEYSFDGIKKLMNEQWKDSLVYAIPDLVKARLMTKADAKDLVKSKIGDSNDLALKVLMTIYSYQTEHEKSAQRCSDYNGVGFSKFDVQILTSIAQGYKSRGYLSKKQYNLLAWKMPKYGKQFYEHLERRAANVS